jgi:AMMECR1 domain-containing protein
MDAAEPLIRAVRDAARNVLGDPRFDDRPVTYGELPDLEIEISVLSPLRPASGPLEFEPLDDGIYLVCGARAGVFLPQVARETGWSREQLLDRLCTEKIGLPPGSWRQPEAKLFLFSTMILGPVAFE